MSHQSNMCHAPECKEPSLEDWYYCDLHFGTICGDCLAPMETNHPCLTAY